MAPSVSALATLRTSYWRAAGGQRGGSWACREGDVSGQHEWGRQVSVAGSTLNARAAGRAQVTGASSGNQAAEGGERRAKEQEVRDGKRAALCRRRFAQTRGALAATGVLSFALRVGSGHGQRVERGTGGRRGQRADGQRTADSGRKAAGDERRVASIWE